MEYQKEKGLGMFKCPCKDCGRLESEHGGFLKTGVLPDGELTDEEQFKTRGWQRKVRAQRHLRSCAKFAYRPKDVRKVLRAIHRSRRRTELLALLPVALVRHAGEQFPGWNEKRSKVVGREPCPKVVPGLAE
jgi:hypothetical protein